MQISCTIISLLILFIDIILYFHYNLTNEEEHHHRDFSGKFLLLALMNNSFRIIHSFLTNVVFFNVYIKYRSNV